MMLIGLFMAVFLTGMLFYLVGIGDAIAQREVMQDASDAAALSTAIWHARGMNFIVLMNLLMASLVGILLILNVVLTLIRIAQGIVIGLMMIPFAAAGLAGLLAVLESVYEEVNAIYEGVEPAVFAVLEVLYTVSDTTRKVVPAVGLAVGALEVVNHQGPPVQFGIAAPTRETLPVTEDEYNVLCERAAEGIVSFLVPDFLPGKSLIEGAAGALANTFSDYLCGDSGGGSGGSGDKPVTEETFTRFYPITPESEQCFVKGLRGDDSPDESVCDAAAEDQEKFTPDQEGDCPSTFTLAECELFGNFVRLAREQCNPGNGGITNFLWQEVEYSIKYQFVVPEGAVPNPRTGEVPGDWMLVQGSLQEEARAYKPKAPKEVERVPESAAETDPDAYEGSIETSQSNGQEGEKHSPCRSARTDRFGQRFSNEWNLNGGFICKSDYERNFPENPTSGQEVTFHYVEVTKALGCSKDKKYEIPVGDSDAEPLDFSEGGDKQPFKVEDDAFMGGDDFQIRSIITGDLPRRMGERGAQLAAWGNCPDGDCASIFKTVGNLARASLAQAEFFYNETHSRPEWMWNMNWKGRLRRFAMPGDGYKDEDGGSSSQGMTDGMRGFMETNEDSGGGISDVIAH